MFSARGCHLFLLTLAATAAAYARTALSPLQETMRTALALSDNQMALLQGTALALPLVLAAVPVGVLIDRYSRARLLCLFAATNVLGSVLTAFTSSFTLLFLARSLTGLTACATNSAGLSLLADLYAPSQRGRATMVMAVGGYAGMSGAFALGGALIAIFGGGPLGWRHAMLWMAAPLAAVAALLSVMRELPRTELSVENPSGRGRWAELWRYRMVLAPLLSGVILAEIAIGAVLVWAAPSLSRYLSLPLERVGFIMAAAVLVSGIAGPIVGGVLADLCQRSGGPRRTMSVLSWAMLLSTPATFFPLMPGAPASILLVVFITLIGAIVVMATTLFTLVIPNEIRGLCLTVMIAASALFGVAIAPLLVSLLSGLIGGPALIGHALTGVGVAATLLGASAFAFGRRVFPIATVP